MSWMLPKLSQRVCKYLLQRYLGQFFQQKLTLDQLSVDLMKGTGKVEKVSLDVQALNELGEKQNWPLEFVHGYIEKIELSVPITTILNDSSHVEVHGVRLTLQPKQRTECATSMFESMWSSMTSSMQLAQECAQQDNASSVASAEPLESIERFAEIIDSIFCRVKLRFFDVVIRIEHLPQNSTTGVGIVINIDKLEYTDESGEDPSAQQMPESTQEQKKSYVVSAFTTKKLILEGVTFSTVEFPAKSRAFPMSDSSCFEKDKDDSDDTLVPETDEGQPTSGDSSGESIEVLHREIDPKHNVILFGKLCNSQEIRIRLKQSDVVAGPKVSFEINLGAFLVYLSPRQVHLLLELANGLATPDSGDTSNTAPKQKIKEKPMTDQDFQRIEQQLQEQLRPLSKFHIPGLQGAQTWSTADYDSDEEFLPMKSKRGGWMTDSTTSAASSSMESSLTSSVMSSVSDTSFRSRRKPSNIELDPTAEISHFQIQLTSLAVLILHEDVLSVNEKNELVESTVQQMQNNAHMFFLNINKAAFFSSLMRDFECTKADFERACAKSHLRLLACRLNIEGDETTTSSAFSIAGKLTVSRMEFLECITENNATEYVPLLTFTTGQQQQQKLTPNPNMKLTFKHIAKTSKHGSKCVSKPKTEISVNLDTCTIELDITIVDRICALLNPQPICVVPQPRANVWGQPTPIATAKSESRVDVKVQCSCLSVRLRFPIPDFRINDRLPWWQRNIRSEFLLIKLHHANAQTAFETNQLVREYTMHCHEIDVFYYESARSEPVAVALASSNARAKNENCELKVVVFPVKEKQDAEPPVKKEVDMTQSMYGSFADHFGSDTGPFSQKMDFHWSDTAHPTDTGEAESSVVPGEKEEIQHFIRTTTDDSRIQIHLTLTTLSLQLISKHNYEVIYNRINDLLLWEPGAPKLNTATSGAFVSTPNPTQIAEDEEYGPCKKGTEFESESDVDDEDDNGASSIYQSAYESRPKQKAQATPVKVTTQSYLTFNLYIAQGLLNLFPPSRDSAGNVIPGQQGEFLLQISNAHLFMVSGYCGDDDLGFVCVEAYCARLYHCNMMSIHNQNPPLKEVASHVGKHLHPTIIKSEPAVLVDAKSKGGKREMLSVAIRIQAKHETHHVKTIRVAVGINKATLHHKVCSEPNTWISHFCDFFKVADYPIQGYTPKDVLTELHVHLWDCAIDYRPLHIPLRSVITMGTFSMSSHLSAQANSSTLRFVAEDCALFLSDKAPPKKGIASQASADLKRDYVRVINLSLFELSLQTNDKKSKINPHFDLRASNDTLHIRTCADSAKALMKLLTYYASDGDLQTQSAEAESGSVQSSPLHRANEPQLLVDVEPQAISKLTQIDHQKVNDMMEDAMLESYYAEKNAEVSYSGDGAEVFYFPGENVTSQDTHAPLPQVKQELGDVERPSSTLSDDDYIFLEKPPTVTSPIIKWKTSDSVRTGENHFLTPSGRTNALEQPKHFPTPVLRYTLCEMTIIWHMYGGSDFKATSEAEKKCVSFADSQLSENVRFSRTNAGRVTFAEKKKSKREWQVMGGPYRDHDVLMELQLNKVRFRHDTYPENTTQASWQVLAVSDFEIRDRLAKNEINKFLYQYVSEGRPRRSHADMLSIQAVHVRPDRQIKREECNLKVSLAPLRLNIDQDALLFLIKFFKECGSDDEPNKAKVPSKHNTPTHQPPIMTMPEDELSEALAQSVLVEDSDEENMFSPLGEKRRDSKAEEASNVTEEARQDESQPVYFRHVVFAPTVPIKLDYQGKHLNMSHGGVSGILLGLTQLNGSELQLKRLDHKRGILGLQKLIDYCIKEWTNDIKQTQVPNLLKGIGPMNAIISLIQGIADLFWIPIQQYRKDKQLLRGLKKGANSFTTSTAMAALELTSRILHLIQITAETAYDMLSPGPSVKRQIKGKGKKKRYSQPQDIREGVSNAFQVVKEGVSETASNIMQTATYEHEQKGISGAVGSVIRQIPPAIVNPIIIGAQATNHVIDGVRGHLMPDARREASQKWRSDDG